MNEKLTNENQEEKRRIGYESYKKLIKMLNEDENLVKEVIKRLVQRLLETEGEVSLENKHFLFNLLHRLIESIKEKVHEDEQSKTTT